MIRLTGPVLARAAGSAAVLLLLSGSALVAQAPTSSLDPRELADLARARADSLRHPYTEADVRFMTAMIAHHSQAIVMSEMARTNGASGPVATLAERIISTQQDEIATMQQWLRERGLPVPEPSAAHAMHDMSHDGGHGMQMPGMLTDAELDELRALRGKAFEEKFLASMIKHHRGATAMVSQLFGSYGAAQDESVFKFASDVNVDQTTEIARMQRMLFEIAVGVPMP